MKYTLKRGWLESEGGKTIAGGFTVCYHDEVLEIGVSKEYQLTEEDLALVNEDPANVDKIAEKVAATIEIPEVKISAKQIVDVPSKELDKAEIDTIRETIVIEEDPKVVKGKD